MFYFRVRDICLIINYMINDDDYVINMMSLLYFLSYANDTTIEFIIDDEQNFVIVVDSILINYLIKNSNRFFNIAKATRYFIFLLIYIFARSMKCFTKMHRLIS